MRRHRASHAMRHCDSWIITETRDRGFASGSRASLSAPVLAVRLMRNAG